MINATNILQDGLDQLVEKGKMRDQPGGERNMLTTIALFNSLTGRDLGERDGWLFMLLLKITRLQTGKFNPDDYIDLAAYAALLGECRSKSANG